MPETSYNPNYASYADWSVRQSPVPASTHNLPSSIAASSSVQSSLITTKGFSQISVGLQQTQSGTLSIQRYLDAGGTVIQGSAVTIPLTANITGNLDIQDGRPFAAFRITVTNSAASTATISAVAILLQAADLSGPNNTVDGSSTITTGGTAQNLFGGIIPNNGFAIYNPDASNDLWISDSSTAVANGTGSIRITANGGGYETPANYRPCGVVSVIGSVTGQKFTAKWW